MDDEIKTLKRVVRIITTDGEIFTITIQVPIYKGFSIDECARFTGANLALSHGHSVRSVEMLGFLKWEKQNDNKKRARRVGKGKT